MVKTEVIIKSIICFMMFIVECVLILRMQMFSACKAAYGLKLLKIIFIFYQAFIKDSILQEQCAKWLNNPAHHFKRNSEDVNTHRPLTMVFNCNFQRMYEEKEKKEDANTIHYYRFNQIFQSTLIATEIIYCLICMGVFLLVIYWSQEGQEEVILGKDDKYISDEGDDDAYEEKLKMRQIQMERDRQA